MRFTILQLMLVCVAFAAGGCDQGAEQRVPVAGTVLIDGRPLNGGMIRFVPESGRPASSAIMADGSFEVASESVNRASAIGLPRGRYRVQVSASKVVDDKTIRWDAPEKYADFRTSGLNVTIDKPTDDLVVELTWEGNKPSDEADISSEAGDPSGAERGGPSPVTNEPSSDGEDESI